MRTTTDAGHGSAGSPVLPTNRLSRRLDGAILWIGKAVSWLWLATLAVVLFLLLMLLRLALLWRRRLEARRDSVSRGERLGSG